MDQAQFASMGGNARAKKLSKKRRREIALMGVTARQKKRTPREIFQKAADPRSEGLSK